MNASSDQTDPTQRYTNLHVKNLGEKLDDEEVKELFLPFGTIDNLVVVKDETGRSGECGFVSYESHESAARAVEKLSGKTLGDRDISVVPIITLQDRMACAERLLQGQQTPPGVSVCVTNLEEETDEAQLRESFDKFGTITSAKVCSFVCCEGGCV